MPQPDEMLDGGETFFYRSGNWTNKTGMCVSTSRGAALTQEFCQRYGRSPTEPEVVAPKRAPAKPRRVAAKPKPPTKAERDKAKVVKAAIAKAVASRAKGKAKGSR